MAGPLARLYATLGLDAREFDEGIGRAQKSISGFGRTTDLAIAGIAGGVTVGLLNTANAARAWESAFAGVRKTMDTTGMTAEQEASSFAVLEQEIRGLAKTIPVTSTELAGLAEAAGALGVRREDIIGFTRVTAMLGSTTDVVAQDAAMALGKIGTALELTGEDYDRFGNTLVDLGNKGASTESQILDTANRIAGTGRVVGLTADEILGWSAALANVGILPEAAGGSFQKFAYTIQKAAITGGDKLDVIARAAGMTSEAFQELWGRDSNAALVAFITGYSNLGEQAQMTNRQVLGLDDIRISDFIAKLTGNTDNLTRSLDIATGAWQDNSAMVIEAGKRYGTTDSRILIAANKLNDFSITLGNTFLPILATGAEHLGNFVSILGDAAIAFPAVTNVVTPLVTALAGLTALRFGARFLGLGPGVDALLSKGLGKAWQGAVAGTKVGIAAAGKAAGIIYAGAVAVVSKLGTMLSAAWVALGRPGSQVMMRATMAGTMVAGGFLAGLAKGLTVVGIAAVVGEVVNEGLRQAGIEPKGWDKVGSQFRGSFSEQLGLSFEEAIEMWDFDRADVAARADELGQQFGTEVVQGFLRGTESGLQPGDPGTIVRKALYDPLSSVTPPSGMVIGKGWEELGRRTLAQIGSALTSGADEAFAAARKAISQGFGSIRAALANPPQLISRDDRLGNMEKRQRQIFRNLRKAVEIDDPFNQRYWVRAAIAQQERMDRVRGGTETKVGDIRKTFKRMGADIDGTWLDTERSARTHGQRGKRAAVSAAGQAADGVASQLNGLDAFGWGAQTIGTWASGMLSQVGTVVAVARQLSAAFAAFFKTGSPPKEGPLSTIDQWGEPLIDAWLGPMQSRGIGKIRRTADTLAGAFQPSPSLGVRGRSDAERGRGDVIHYHISPTIEGQPMHAETPREVVQQLRRAARMGMLAPRERRGWAPG